MNISVIPDAPIKKASKLLPQQAKAGFTHSMIDLSVFIPDMVLENREKLMEINTDDPRLEIAFDAKKLRGKLKRYLEQCKSIGLVHTIGRAPSLPCDTKREDMDWVIYELTMESIAICAEAGCKYIIIEPIVKNVTSINDMERNEEFYISFTKSAKEHGIQILIRNDYRCFNGHMLRGEFSDARSLALFADKLNTLSESNIFGICMDIGVCNICGQNLYEYALDLGEHVKAVIIRENNGNTDNSLIPFSSATQNVSQMDWLSIFRGLRKIGFDGELIYDFRSSQAALSHLLRQDILAYAKKVIDFIVWQILMEQTVKKYDKRALFGAGNMCRNYMKCYGSEYPPIFTCDNNSSIWGTKFEGLDVKSPDSLKELPSDCAIFICNIYYDEIEKQLRDMGIMNPIERFNDEYMPSIYTDRFDAEKREVHK